ncbi:PAS domain S-box-containing protein [Palleronia marisminoris]|uniref:histidine kinase n=1 Tax=Palleronia marisminoris TaxID=315423 RepID=A0A1Y5RTH0_9RHOB|nr:PAS domain-containing protein [Palleronia marisminoris]SFG49296.1 PAS domain S-box-containing protein [Palleronia marisminoris]SLN25084.1 Blue-light-activated histidine kinase 2 [Palleronia marisminoris]
MPDKSFSEDTLEASIGSFPTSMVLSDPHLPDNPLVFVNGAFEKLTLYPSDVVIGRNCRFLQCDDTDPDTVRELGEAIAAERDVSVDILNRKADGSTFWNRLVVTPVRDDMGDVRVFLGILTEIDHPETGNAAAIDDESRQMLRELQHRVKNHLAMVVSLVRLHSRREVTKESFEALSHRIQSLALLYEELSPHGAVMGGAQTLAGGAYLSRVANTIGGLEGRTAIRLNVLCDEVELSVETGARLGMILTEFITNAFEHAFKGRDSGLVQVTLTRMEGDHVRLRVEDDGIGLPDGSTWPDNAPSLRNRTIEAKEADGTLDTRGNKRESGAGGSIVRAMVTHMKGDLNVTSSESGTIVTLDFQADA